MLGTACENLDANAGKICLFWDSLSVYWLAEFIEEEMVDQSRLNYGMEKLNNALDALEASLVKFDKQQNSRKAKVLDAASLEKQNAELTAALDAEKARATVLEDANNEVVERLDAAVENISDVLRAV